MSKATRNDAGSLQLDRNLQGDQLPEMTPPDKWPSSLQKSLDPGEVARQESLTAAARQSKTPSWPKASTGASGKA